MGVARASVVVSANLLLFGVGCGLAVVGAVDSVGVDDRDGSAGGGGSDVGTRDDGGPSGETGAPLPPAPGTLQRVLTIKNTSATPLKDFPILVVLDATRITYDRCMASGADLRFTDANGGLIPHEIETWNATGKSFVWVRVPSLAASPAVTTITMHYGYSASAPPPSAAAPKEVWDSSFVGVWHMAPDARDSTTKHLSSLNHGGIATIGSVGPALQFDGAQYVDTGVSENLTAVTIEAWSYALNNPVSGGFWSGPVMHEGYNLQWNCQSSSFCRSASAGLNPGDSWFRVSLGALPPQVWHHLAATFDATTIRGYVNGEPKGSTPIQSGLTPEGAGLTVKIAADVQLRAYFIGSVDEVRISSVVRNDAWIATELASMTDALVTYGAEEAGK